MLELTQSGLPLFLNDDGSLVFNAPLEFESLSHRAPADMKEYLAEPDSFADFSKPSAYDMYRGVCLAQDKDRFKAAGLRFDITVFHPGLLGKEFCKTIGHFHPANSSGIRYPEIYEIIKGKALFLAQKMDENYENVLDFFAVEAEEGDDIIFPPGYGHVAVNPTNDVLVTSNWTADNFKSEYEPMAKFHGAAYYAAKGANGLELIANKNYRNTPELKKLKPKEIPEFGLAKNQPSYLTGQKTPNMLEFLNKPELYSDKLSIQNCFTLPESRS
jgi:glucose-6-phosphate isomerase